MSETENETNERHKAMFGACIDAHNFLQQAAMHIRPTFPGIATEITKHANALLRAADPESADFKDGIEERMRAEGRSVREMFQEPSNV